MSFPVVDSVYAGNPGVASGTSGSVAGAPIATSPTGITAAAAQQPGVLASSDQPPSVITALSSGQAGGASEYALYTVDGLLNTNAAGSGSGSVLPQTVDKAIVAALSAKAVGAGVYNGMGVLESLPFSRITDLGSLLRYNPQLSYIQVGNSYNQGIRESLNIIA